MDNLTLAKEWLNSAISDYRYAQIGLKEEQVFPQVAFLSQQVAEKFLKGFLVSHKIEPPRIHDLTKLLDNCIKITPDLLKLRDACELLTGYYIQTRYPPDIPDLTIEEINDAFQNAKIIKETIEKLVPLEKNNFAKKGFTLLELMVVMGILAILMATVFTAVNPARQFSLARDTQRKSDLLAISTGIYQYFIDNGGKFPAGFPTTPTSIGNSSGNYDLTPILVSRYLSSIPQDPTSGTLADTQYKIYKNAKGQIVLTAIGELTEKMIVER